MVSLLKPLSPQSPARVKAFGATFHLSALLLLTGTVSLHVLKSPVDQLTYTYWPQVLGSFAMGGYGTLP